jgi:hypothetical protein
MFEEMTNALVLSEKKVPLVIYRIREVLKRQLSPI